MKKEDILSIEEANKNKDVISFLESKYPEVKAKFQGMTNKKRLALFLTDRITEPTCIECTNPVDFVSLTNCQTSPDDRKSIYGGWKSFCSISCMTKSSLTISKRKNTMLSEYGVDSFMKTQEAKEKFSKAWSQEKKDSYNKKVEQTAKDKHGVSHHTKSDAWKKSVETSMMNKYGVKNAFQLTEKVIAGVQKKYGETHYNKTEEGRAKLSRNSAMRNNHDIRLKSKVNRMIQGYKNVNPIFLQCVLKNDKVLLENFLNSIASVCENNRVLMAKHIGIGSSTLNRYMRDMGLETLYLNIGKGSSAGEIEVYDWIKTICGDKVKRTNKTILDGKHLDIYIEEHALAIEYNGIYYHSEGMGCDSKYHLEKTVKCEEKGIQLLHIFETEWNNPIKREIWKSMILHKLGLTNNKIHARKCTIREIESKESRNFLEENHLAGFAGAEIHYGAFFNNELVSVFSIGKSRFSSNEKELIRFAVKKNTSVTGIFSKFKANHDLPFVTYADRRYSNGNTYLKSFSKRKETIPSWYGFSKKTYELQSRFVFQKHNLKHLPSFSEEKTSYQIMLESGFDRIWDCGTFKFYD